MATVLPRIWPLGETNAYLNTRKQRAQLEKQKIIAAKYDSTAKIAIDNTGDEDILDCSKSNPHSSASRLSTISKDERNHLLSEHDQRLSEDEQSKDALKDLEIKDSNKRKLREVIASKKCTRKIRSKVAQGRYNLYTDPVRNHIQKDVDVIRTFVDEGQLFSLQRLQTLREQSRKIQEESNFSKRSAYDREDIAEIPDKIMEAIP